MLQSSGSDAARCPFCGARASGPIATLELYREGRAGQFLFEKHRLVAWHGQRLYAWHAFDNVFPGEGAGEGAKEGAGRTPLGAFSWHNGAWWLHNQSPASFLPLHAPPVAPGEAMQLKDGLAFRMSRAPRARLALTRLIG